MPDEGNRGGTALLLIDFQEDFLSPGGRMPVDQDQVDPAIEAARRAVAEAEREGGLIVMIANVFRHHAAMMGSPGSAWDGRIDPPGATYLAKWKSNAFSNPDLAPLLEETNVRRVRLAGLYAKACVSATAKAARRRGFVVEVIADATACSSDQSRRHALEKLGRNGIEVI
jgi:nicotinamidase-related amidase